MLMKTPTPSTEGFREWLRLQDPEKKYNYLPAPECPIGCYLRSIGLDYDIEQDRRKETFEWLCDMNRLVTRAEPHTYGAAYQRAQAIEHQRAEAPVVA